MDPLEVVDRFAGGDHSYGGKEIGRVHDGQGTDVTKFGMWSNYLVGIVTFTAVLVLCCGGVALLGGLGALSNP